MTNYPPANRATAWYQDDYPGATMKVTRVVIHTTEGRTLPGYQGGATAPTYTAVPDFANQRLKWYAHFPDEKSSRALKNLAGGVETNTHGALQVELVGTCDPAAHKAWGKAPHIYWATPPAWAIRDLADFAAWVSKTHGVPLTSPGATWTAYPESYGAGGQRFSGTRWNTFSGFCGHQHVPENTHGDPGAFPWGLVQTRAKALLASKVPPGATPRWDALYEAARNLLKAQPVNASTLAVRTRLSSIMAFAARRSSRY